MDDGHGEPDLCGLRRRCNGAKPRHQATALGGCARPWPAATAGDLERSLPPASYRVRLQRTNRLTARVAGASAAGRCIIRQGLACEAALGSGGRDHRSTKHAFTSKSDRNVRFRALRQRGNGYNPGLCGAHAGCTGEAVGDSRPTSKRNFAQHTAIEDRIHAPHCNNATLHCIAWQCAALPLCKRSLQWCATAAS